MYQYFKTLQTVANSDKRNFSSIKDLTVEIANSAGYRREIITCKNGNQHVRTKYGIVDGLTGERTITWDDALVAKWLIYFKKAFMAKFLKHPELKHTYTDMIQRTFSIFFDSIQLDKITHDAAVVSRFNLTLSARIGEALFLIGSKAREERMENYKKIQKGELTLDEAKANNLEVAYNDKPTQNMQKAFEHGMESLNYLMEEGFSPSNGLPVEEEVLVISLKQKMSQLDRKYNSTYSSDLLDTLLYSNEYVSPSQIKKFINSKCESLNVYDTFTASKQLKQTWNLIKSELRLSMDVEKTDTYDWNCTSEFDKFLTVSSLNLLAEKTNTDIDIVKKDYRKYKKEFKGNVLAYCKYKNEMANQKLAEENVLCC